MMPAFKPGDHVLTFNWGSVKVSDVVVFMNKDTDFLKRIDKIENGKIFVFGDYKKESSKFDPISQKDIIGKVIFRY